MDTYFNKLKNLVDSKRLELFIIVAPPRSNSSLVEHSLTLSPDVQGACHEPFLNARKEGFVIDDGYREIYDAIGGETFENSNEVKSFVIKEMAHWIGSNKEYKNFLSLSNSPIVFLIRNPLLTVESRVRRVLKTLDMRPGLSLQQKLLDILAVDSGFEDFHRLEDFSEIEAQCILEKIQPEFLGIKDIYNTPVLSLQNDLLNYYARKSKYVNWRDLLDKKLYQEKDYAYFEEILQINQNRVSFEELEFKKLEEIRDYLKIKDQTFIVLDTTDLRAEPEERLKYLCLKLGIRFSQEMIVWGEKEVDFHTQQEREYEKIWYEKLFLSSEMNPPTEISPNLKMFPEFIKKYLREFNLPVYVSFSQQKEISTEMEISILNKEFLIKVTSENLKSLQDLGVVGESVIEGDILVKLKDIDPIHAIVNDPSLSENEDFLEKKNNYNEEIRIVLDELRDSREPSKEMQSQFKIK